MGTSLSNNKDGVVMTARSVPSTKNVLQNVKQQYHLKWGLHTMTCTNKSIIDDDQVDECYLCGRVGHMDEHHIFGGSVRSKCDQLGLVVHICRDCHREVHDKVGPKMEYLHRVGQRTYEQKIGTRSEFIRDFIRSYL